MEVLMAFQLYVIYMCSKFHESTFEFKFSSYRANAIFKEADIR